jgi:hypothetical protein
VAKTIDEIKLESRAWLEKQLALGQFVFSKTSLDKSTHIYLEQELVIADLNNQYVFIKAEHESRTNAFKNNLWVLLLQFLDLAFDDGWYFTGHYAYQLSVDNFSMKQNQITIATRKKSNNLIDLPGEIKVVASYDKEFDSKAIEQKTFLATNYTLLKPELLVIKSTETEYRNYQDEIISHLKSSERDESFILEYFNQNSQPVLQARLIGALRAIDDSTLRIELEKQLKLTKVKISIRNPFSQLTLTESRERPTYLNRFELSMQKAINQLKQMDKPRRLSKKLGTKDLDQLVIDDTYHSLTIEGYTVTRDLLEYLKKEDSLPNSFPEDLRNQLAAKGFMNVLAYIRELNKSKFVINERLSYKLFQELWKPSISANLVRAELDVYRKHMVAIIGAQYVPPAHEKVPYMLDEVFDYLHKIDNGFELGIFLHFFYVGVHPHGDGNGRISRFLMNLAFIQDKYKWLTIPSEDKKNYFAALEKSQLEDNISYFAEYIKSQY